jgi:hypothetical protein
MTNGSGNKRRRAADDVNGEEKSMQNDHAMRTFPDDDQPRIGSRELALKLGMSHEKMLALIERHRAELESLGPLIATQIPPEDE